MEKLKRCTIGALIGFHVYERSHVGGFAHPFIRGMQAAARDNDANFMVACGIARGGVVGSERHRPAWPEPGADTDFIPVGPWNTDGLIFLVPLRSLARIQYARGLVDRGFPVLFVGGDSGYPAIIVDNEGGIRQIMDHLVQHGHRDIAFIAGDEQDLGDSMARLEAYRRGVRELGLNDDPELLQFGQHWETGGYNAMRRMLQSGVKFTAAMCSNDLSALGVIRALHEAGVRIPWDVAVTGFDDIVDGLAQVPPLTSVHFPMFETGYRSLVLLLRRIRQGPASLPELTRVSTWLARRQSCGCLPETVTKAVISTAASQHLADQSQQSTREAMTRAMLDAVLAETSRPHEDEFRMYCSHLVEGFFRSLEDGNFSHFQTALTELLQHVEMTSDENAQTWQSAISVLRKGAFDFLEGDRDVLRSERAEDLLHQARTLLSESVQRWHVRLQVQQTHRDEDMGILTARLISSTDEDQLYGALREDLPLASVRSCNVIFFEPQAKDPTAMSVLHPLEKDASLVHFESRQFPPRGLYPESEPFNLALLPMLFQNEALGYVAFDGGNLDPLATLVNQLSSSIKSVQLHAKVLELSLTDGLTGVYNRRYFEIFLQKETERSQRYNRDLAVIMLDIDHFKQYNDAFGHPAGDEALQTVTRCVLQGARRGLDVVSRYGGEEFAIILPETGVDGALVVAEQVRRQVEGNPAFLQPTTVSLGIASLCGKELHPQTLVNQADRALYQAKAQGRNRTVLFQDWMLKAAHVSSLETGESVLDNRKDKNATDSSPPKTGFTEGSDLKS